MSLASGTFIGTDATNSSLSSAELAFAIARSTGVEMSLKHALPLELYGLIVRTNQCYHVASGAFMVFFETTQGTGEYKHILFQDYPMYRHSEL